MGATVARLDKSGWSALAKDRLQREDGIKAQYALRAEWEASEGGQAYKQAWEAHPLVNVLDDQVSDESLEATEGAGRWLFKAWDAENGHREAFAMRVRPNPRATLKRAIARDLAWMVPRGLGDREHSIRNAAQRAKQEVRRLCKAMKVNSLWTLTYRANQTDRDLALKHLDVFRRKVQALIPGWVYVAVLEKQERGAFHIHLATHALPKTMVSHRGAKSTGSVKLKSWDVMRAIWRSVTGDLGGNFDEAKRQKRWGKGAKPLARSCGQIASYIAGYVAKDMLAGELNRKRYSATRGIEVPECYRAWFEADEATMHGLVELAFAGVGDRITRTWLDSERLVFFVESDDTGPPS